VRASFGHEGDPTLHLGGPNAGRHGITIEPGKWWEDLYSPLQVRTAAWPFRRPRLGDDQSDGCQAQHLVSTIVSVGQRIRNPAPTLASVLPSALRVHGVRCRDSAREGIESPTREYNDNAMLEAECDATLLGDLVHCCHRWPVNGQRTSRAADISLATSSGGRCPVRYGAYLWRQTNWYR
jgi:hypothetical protein